MSPRTIRRTSAVPGQPKASNEWRTPRACFDALDDEFDFGIDLAATAENALCAQWLGPGSLLAEDALAVTCIGGLVDTFGLTAFLNPPYSSDLIAPFLAKAVEEAAIGMVIVALVPYTPDVRWWAHVEHATEIRRIPHRVPYLQADGTTKAGAMFPSCVAVFRPQPGVVQPAAPRYVTWTWRKLVP